MHLRLSLAMVHLGGKEARVQITNFGADRWNKWDRKMLPASAQSLFFLVG